MNAQRNVEDNMDNAGISSTAPARPTTLNILLDNGIKSPIIPSFRTPSLGDLQPILRSEVEKLLQQWKASPQTPGTFLNPKHVTEEQERFANVFTQKLNELQDSGCLASITAGFSPAATAVGSTNLYNVNLPQLNAQNLPNFAELCRQVAQQQQQQPGLSAAPASILLYSPTGFNTLPISSNQTNSSQAAVTQASDDLTAAQNPLQGSVSINVPTATLSTSNKELTTLQLPNGLRFEITTNGGVSQSSVFKMLGIETPTMELKPAPDSTPRSADPGMWPLQIQTSISAEATPVDGNHSGMLASSHDGNDTRPSSVDNSVDQGDSGRPIRSSSSISSNSSNSQSNGKDNITCSNLSDVRLDPTEQSRMRLERKRARNRDAARKCRERKIRLIKSLEKEVSHLSEENKALRSRLSRSRTEVERLKLFVVNHLEKDCPALSNKVV